MKEYDNISEAYKEIDELKKDYDYYRKYQTKLKIDYNNWPGPPESCYKETWESSINEQILFNREKLRFLENEIKEVRKEIKRLNQEQNAKNNISKYRK